MVREARETAVEVPGVARQRMLVLAAMEDRHLVPCVREIPDDERAGELRPAEHEHPHR